MKAPQPPNWADSLLARFLSDTLWENISGDLYEIFQEEVEMFGLKKARRRYIRHGLGFLRFRRLRKSNYSKTQHTMDLFKNYFKVSWRDLIRHKTFAAINLTGLIAGFTACLLILQYVFYEVSFDRFHSDGERIYRVVNDRFQNGELVQHGTITYPAVGPALLNDFPEIEQFTRMTVGRRENLRRNGEAYLLEDYLFADEHFLNFFDFPLLYGDPSQALDEPNEVVLTAEYARRILKEGETLQDLIGQNSGVFSRNSFKISGILEDIPANSHLQFDVLISYRSFVEVTGGAADNSWEWSDFYHYVKLKEGTDQVALQKKLDNFGEKYFKNGEVSGAQEEFYLQPLNEAHLYSDLEYEIGETSNGKVVWLMLAVAIFVIVIAWVNFINLSTSRATERAKEVGIRKSLGAQKSQLFYQFLIEAFLLNILALGVSLILTWSLQTAYANVTNLPLSMYYLWTGTVLGIPFPVVGAALLILALFLISLYPSQLLSAFKTQDTLKGKYSKPQNALPIRKALVVFQFAAAMLLITGSLTIYQQITFMQDSDLGMNMDNTIVYHGPARVNWDSTFIPKVNALKSEISSIAGVQSVTASSRVFGNQMGKTFRIQSPALPNAKNLSCNFINIDHEFTKQYEIELLAGRHFRANDHNFDGALVNTVVMTKAAVNYFGFADPESAIGQKLNYWRKDWEIVGVVEDFHQISLHEAIVPILFIPYYETGQYYSVKLDSKLSQQQISAISDVYEKFFPHNYVDYFYLDTVYKRQYQEDEMIQKIAQIFTIITIIIALLGLYGLVLITINQKTKEIAVRKVLGAQLLGILGTLGKSFFGVIGLAIVISLPISYYLLTQWLENYEYRIDVQWGSLLAAALTLALISILTLLIQAGKVTQNNPADSLKYE